MGLRMNSLHYDEGEIDTYYDIKERPSIHPKSFHQNQPPVFSFSLTTSYKLFYFIIFQLFFTLFEYHFSAHLVSIIDGALKFRDMQVQEVMTPISRVFMLSCEEKLNAAVRNIVIFVIKISLFWLCIKEKLRREWFKYDNLISHYT